MKEKKLWSLKIQEARQNIGLTQKQLATKMGVTVSAIINFENGVNYPSLYNLHKMCDLLKLNVFEMMRMIPNSEYFEKEISEIEQILEESDFYIDKGKHDTFCILHIPGSFDDGPDGDLVTSAPELVLTSLEIKQQLYDEYKQRLKAQILSQINYYESKPKVNTKKKPD